MPDECETAAELAAYTDDAEPVTDPDEAERLYLAALDEAVAEQVYRELVAGREPEPNPDVPW